MSFFFFINWFHEGLFDGNIVKRGTKVFIFNKEGDIKRFYFFGNYLLEIVISESIRITWMKVL